MTEPGLSIKFAELLPINDSVKRNKLGALPPTRGYAMAFKQSLNRAVKALSARHFPDDMSPTSVSDVMTRDVLSVYPGQSFAEAVGLMANRPFRHVLVIHPNGRLAGVISDRDLLRAMGGTADWKEKKVSDIMTRTYLRSLLRLHFRLPPGKCWRGE
jgi:CBS-domain-containing membrane protein